ncbi:MAG: hypothetical protein HOB84_14665 [Candidatus Marinimicrobia bacterium]|jgi:hypothetical protein|nr:hypothetical protein [Candidatus Neomarinimicrobiota bacterium]MBT4361529.1 hypothetical protein [Candidatus Neomarinimicrobiota bacterium]MBT4716008.1 hypothetical protein [Candidatus Neomarinimicrobiota bacterium]MBT4945909.1 hypothetical protein [Candidatus Neomarinimicrobiota bacterium]MBT5268004.1 hypothetical protein [Candidatus Neomarinimicrobiota bacterium]
MKPKHDVELQKKICLDFGADIGSELCQEVGLLMEECPECKIYYDTMQRSIKLYKVVEDECELPESVSERLFKVLDLDQLKKDV